MRLYRPVREGAPHTLFSRLHDILALAIGRLRRVFSSIRAGSSRISSIKRAKADESPGGTASTPPAAGISDRRALDRDGRQAERRVLDQLEGRAKSEIGRDVQGHDTDVAVREQILGISGSG